MSTPVLGFTPVADESEHRYRLWSVLNSVSVQSLFSIEAIPSNRVVPTTSANQNTRRSTELKSSGNAMKKRRVKECLHICLKMAFLKLAFLNCSIPGYYQKYQLTCPGSKLFTCASSMLASVISAFSKSDPSKVASKKDAEYRFASLKFAFLTILC